ncbi:MAG: hydroxymyristoyl-ACP dehydratase [Rhodanobacteraceae bacterium]
MKETAELLAPLCVAASHPSLPGHFPDNPMVPGVVLLDAVAGLLERDGYGRLAHIVVVKFLTPLEPEQSADLRIATDGKRVRFRIERGATTILSGEGRLA